MREAECAVAGTALIVAEAHGDGGEQGRELFAVTTHVAAVTIINVRRTAVLFSARAAVGLFAGRTKMMRHAIYPGVWTGSWRRPGEGTTTTVRG